MSICASAKEFNHGDAAGRVSRNWLKFRPQKAHPPCPCCRSQSRLAAACESGCRWPELSVALVIVGYSPDALAAAHEPSVAAPKSASRWQHYRKWLLGGGAVLLLPFRRLLSRPVGGHGTNTEHRRCLRERPRDLRGAPRIRSGVSRDGRRQHAREEGGHARSARQRAVSCAGVAEARCGGGSRSQSGGGGIQSSQLAGASSAAEAAGGFKQLPSRSKTVVAVN